MTFDIKRHALGASIIGVVGLLTGAGMNFLYDNGVPAFLPDNGNVVPLVALPGAAVAGFICAAMFGRAGCLGWLLAYLGGLVATVLGAFFAGAILAPVYGGLYGVVAVGDYLMTQPVLLAAWCVMMGISHQVIVFVMPFKS